MKIDRRMFSQAKEHEVSHLHSRLHMTENALKAYHDEWVLTDSVDVSEKLQTLMCQKQLEREELIAKLAHTENYDYDDFQADNVFDKWKDGL